MINITDKQKCAGCTACMLSCPKEAISMQCDEQGFKYPVVDSSKCVNCGLCDAVCPFDKQCDRQIIQESYAVKHKNFSVLQESTSGGIFTAISDYILKQNGVIYGAAFDNSMVVRHIRATTSEMRNLMRGSKYVQSDLGDIFLQVKNDLLNKKLVLFTGTPCQIAGLKSYLKKDYDELICLDLICHGVPSPLIYKEHIRFLEEKYRINIVDYKFRPKKWGWHIHREIVCGEKKNYHSKPYTDLWRNLYYSRIVTRPSCNNCPYANLNRFGDITIGDCRGIDNVISDFKSDEGVTLAIVNTLKGKDLFEKISNDITYRQINLSDVMQPPLKKSSSPNRYSNSFFTSYNKFGYKKAIAEYCGRMYFLKYYIKKMLRRK